MNQIMDRKKRTILTSVFVFVILMAFGWTGAANAAKHTSTKQANLAPDIARISMDEMVREYEFSELIGDSSLVIIGKVSKISDAFKIRWVDGSVSQAMDVTVDVTETFRGNPNQQQVVIRIKGGLVDDVYEDYAQEPELVHGETYLFFLHQPNVGGGRNTFGDYHYITGMSQGVFQPLEASGLISAEKKKLAQKEALFINAAASLQDVKLDEYQLTGKDILQESISPNDAILSIQSLSQMMAAANEKWPVNEYKLKEDLLSNYETNRNSGFITQEEYDILIAAMNEYAVIVDEDYKEPVDLEAEKEKDRLRSHLDALA